MYVLHERPSFPARPSYEKIRRFPSPPHEEFGFIGIENISINSAIVCQLDFGTIRNSDTEMMAGDFSRLPKRG
jgi:hypothetical protein